MENPKVSVIITTYNYGQFIQEAIESILDQTYKNFEIIVIDDGSTDNTKEVLKPYLNRIKYIYQENSHIPKARNTGILISKGEYLAFLDADDLWEKEKLKIQVEFLDAHPQIDMVFSDACVINQKGVISTSFLNNKKLLRKIPFQTVSVDNKIFTRSIFEDMVREIFILVTSVLVKRKVLIQAGMFDEACSRGLEGIDMWLRVINGCNVGFTDKVLSTYRIHGANTSADPQRWRLAYIKLYKKILSNYSDLKRGIRRFILKNLAQSYWDAGWYHFSKNELKESRKYFLQNWQYLPWNIKYGLYSVAYYFASFLPIPIISLIRRIKNDL